MTAAASPRLSPTALHTIARARLHRSLNAPMQRTPGGAFRPGHTVGRKRPLPRQQHPKAIEADFAAAILTRVLAPVRAALAPLMAALPDMLAANARADADDADAASSPLPIVFVAGIPVAIENPAGSVRRWTDSDGTTGETTMRFAYGFIAGTTGADGEDVDAYVGPVADPHWIYIVHQQRKADGFASYDEDKVMLGFASPDAAEAAYRAQYDDPRFFGGMTTMSVEAFRARLAATDGGMISHGDRADGLGDVSRARGLIDKARAQLSRNALNTNNLQRLAERYAGATTVFQKAQLARQVKAALGVDLVLSDPKVPGLIEKFVHEGVARIESLGNRSLDDVSRIVTHAFTTGARAEDVEKDLAKRYDISERHARFIARDQIGTLTGQLNAARQVELGITKFTWRTMEDERVRPEHEALDGQEFAYDDPPSEGMPGTPYLCRCGAEPVFAGLVAAIDGESDAA